MSQLQRNTRRQSRTRSGIASVELAICLPVVIAITLGAIETASAVYLKQALTAAAYEAALSGTAVSGTDAAARANAQAVLTAHRINTSTISISPTITVNTARGTLVVVTVTAPMGANGLVYRYFSSGTNMSAAVSMVKL